MRAFVLAVICCCAVATTAQAQNKSRAEWEKKLIADIARTLPSKDWKVTKVRLLSDPPLPFEFFSKPSKLEIEVTGPGNELRATARCEDFSTFGATKPSWGIMASVFSRPKKNSEDTSFLLVDRTGMTEKVSQLGRPFSNEETKA